MNLIRVYKIENDIKMHEDVLCNCVEVNFKENNCKIIGGKRDGEIIIGGYGAQLLKEYREIEQYNLLTNKFEKILEEKN